MSAEAVSPDALSSDALSSEAAPSETATGDIPAPVAEAAVAPLAEEAPTCRNCGAVLAGRFCADCGQDSHHRMRSVRQLLTAFVDHFFALDARFVRSAWLLVRRPGLLTREYLAGREVAFVPPLRLYIVCSFLLFFGLSLLNADPSRFTLLPPEEGTPTPTTAVAPSPAGEDTQPAEPTPADVDVGIIRAGDTDGDGINLSFGESEEAQRFSKVVSAKIQQAIDHPDRVSQGLLDRVPLMMFLLLPIFALLLKLLYLRRGWLYVSHFVFSLHVHAFIYLLVLVVSLIEPLVPGDEKELMIALGSLVYIFLAQRRVYGQPRWKTFAKLWLLFWSYLLVFGSAFGLLTLLTIWLL